MPQSREQQDEDELAETAEKIDNQQRLGARR